MKKRKGTAYPNYLYAALRATVLSVVAICSAMMAQSPNAVRVAIPQGELVFTNLDFCAGGEEKLAGKIENRTGIEWASLKFVGTIQARYKTDPNEFVFSLSNVPVGRSRFINHAEGIFGACLPISAKFSYSGGQTRAEANEIKKKADRAAAVLAIAKQSAAESARRKAEAEATRKKRAIAEAAKRAYITGLPVIDSSGPAIFLASDRKCSQQFSEALAMDGLEKRKRIAELISYGCGSIIAGPIHAEIVHKDSGYALVRAAEGKVVDKTGWVPMAWIKMSR